VISLVEYVVDPGTCWYGNLALLGNLMREVKEAGATAIKPQFWPASVYKGHPMEKQALLCELNKNLIEGIVSLATFHKLELWFSVFGLREFKLLEDRFPEALRTVKIAESQNHNFKLITRAMHSEHVGRVLISLSSYNAYIDVFLDDEMRYDRPGFSPKALYCCPKYPAETKDVRFPRAIKGEGDFNDRWFGFSDHTRDSLAAVAAVTMGAKMIEKHVRPIPVTYKLVSDGYLRPYPDSVCDVNSHEFGLMVEKCEDVRRMIEWS